MKQEQQATPNVRHPPVFDKQRRLISVLCRAFLLSLPLSIMSKPWPGVP